MTCVAAARSECSPRLWSGAHTSCARPGANLLAAPRVDVRVVEDPRLLQHGALLDAVERRVLHCRAGAASSLAQQLCRAGACKCFARAAGPGPVPVIGRQRTILGTRAPDRGAHCPHPGLHPSSPRAGEPRGPALWRPSPAPLSRRRRRGCGSPRQAQHRGRLRAGHFQTPDWSAHWALPRDTYDQIRPVLSRVSELGALLEGALFAAQGQQTLFPVFLRTKSQVQQSPGAPRLPCAYTDLVATPQAAIQIGRPRCGA